MLSVHPSHYGPFTTQGFFLNLADMGIDFSKPWWMKDSIDQLSYNGKIYSAYGIATTVSLMSDSPVVFFNKGHAENLHVENLYDVVRDGRWTFDYFMNLIQSSYSDLNGNGTVDEEDQHGLHFPMEQQTYRFVWSLGGKYVVNNVTNNTTKRREILRKRVIQDGKFH